MFTSNYADRQVDVLCLQSESADGRGQLQLRLALPGSGGLVVAGIRRILQLLLIELLTERGSMRYLPDRGTNFLSSLRSSNIASPVELRAAVARELATAAANLKQREQESDPPDEKLKQIVILAASLQATTASVTLAVESEAGVSREIVIPLPLGIST